MSLKTAILLLFFAVGTVALATTYGLLFRAPSAGIQRTQPAPPAQTSEAHPAVHPESHHYRIRNRSFVLTEETPFAIRCVATKGQWCLDFFKQQVRKKPLPISCALTCCDQNILTSGSHSQLFADRPCLHAAPPGLHLVPLHASSCMHSPIQHGLHSSLQSAFATWSHPDITITHIPAIQKLFVLT